jgi:hypothetical protein
MHQAPMRRLDISASLIRSRALVTHAIDRQRWNEIADGAVLQEDGAIVEVGTYRDLSPRHPNVAVIGSGDEVMLPGFVNGHHHIGLTPRPRGSAIRLSLLKAPSGVPSRSKARSAPYPSPLDRPQW